MALVVAIASHRGNGSSPTTPFPIQLLVNRPEKVAEFGPVLGLLPLVGGPEEVPRSRHSPQLLSYLGSKPVEGRSLLLLPISLSFR